MNAIVKGMKLTNLWKQTTASEIEALYLSAIPTRERVAALLETDEKSPIDARIATWLYRYVANTPYLKEFIRFVTGSSSIILNDPIRVCFTNTTIEPMPSAHTCFCILQLPRTFNSYYHLERNFDIVLTDKNYWLMEDDFVEVE